MNPLFATTLLFLTAIIAIVLVLGTGGPVVDLAKETSAVQEAEDAMKILNNYIRDVVAEGEGAKRTLTFTSPELEISASEDSIQYEISAGIELFEYLSRRVIGDITYTSGNGVSCDDDGNLTLENSYLKVELQNVARTTPFASITTTDNIQLINETTYGRTIYPVNSSITINGNASSATGNGYSEILKKGKNLPLCIAHFYINSSAASYDVYYTLYSGADFLVIDIRNVN